MTFGDFIFPCDDECTQVSNAVENNICDCENNLFQYYYIDNDNDGNGNINSDGILFCNEQTTEGYSNNNDDDDDDCFSNIHYCLGTCDGTIVLDDCGVCDGDNSICFDCLGVLNGTAEEDECDVCDGPGSIYECGCSDMPDGNCDCDGNVLDCEDESACNFMEEGSCEYPAAGQDCDGNYIVLTYLIDIHHLDQYHFSQKLYRNNVSFCDNQNVH